MTTNSPQTAYREIERKLLDMAFGKVALSSASAILLSTLIVAALWPIVEHARLLSWYAAMAFVQVQIYLFARRYMRSARMGELEQRKWRAGLVTGGVAAGLCWGSTVFYFPPAPFNPETVLGIFVLPSSPFDPVTVLLMFILAGVTAYASVAMAFVLMFAIAFLICTLLPLSIWLFSFSEHMYVVMGLITLCYLGVMMLLSRRMYAAVRNLLEVSEENKGLRTTQQESDWRMQRFFESAPGFFYTACMTPDGISTMPFASAGIQELFDVTQAEVADSMAALFTVVRAEDIEHIIRAREVSRSNMSPFRIEFRVNHRTRGERWVELNSMPQREPDGSTNWHGFMQDITGRKRLEESLAAREREFRALAENAPDPIYRYDRNCRRIYINQAVERMTGKPLAELLGKSPIEAIPTPDVNAVEVQRAIQQVLDAGEAGELEVAFRAVDGRNMVVHNILVPEFAEDGTVQTVLCIGRDVTARKHMETVLQRNEARFRTLAENLPVAVIRYDAEQRRRYLNPAAERMLHGSMEELLGKVPGDGGVPATPEMIGHYRNKMEEVRGSGDACEFEFVLDALPLERQESFEVRFAPERDVDGNVAGVLAIWFDITGRKQAQQRMELLEHAIGVSTDAIYLVDDDLCFSYVNDTACGILGYTREELLVMGPQDIGPGISREFAKNVMDSSPVGVPISFETQHRTKDGRVFPVELHGIHFERGGRKFGLSVVRDITERKRMEIELQEQSQFQQTLLDALRDANIQLMMIEDGRILYVGNREIAHRMGYADDFIDAQPPLLSIIHPDDRERVDEFYRRRLAGEVVPTRYELGLVTRDGERIEYETSVAVVPGSDPVCTVTIGWDISQRKAIEHALYDSERMLQEAQRIAHVGSWDVDMVNDRLVWSDEIFRIWEIDKAQFKADFAAFLETVHPEDRDRVNRVYHEAVANRSLYEVEHRLLFPDGRVKHILERGEPQYDAHGKPVRFIGTSLDITERKQSELALRTSEEQAQSRSNLLHAIVESSPDVIVFALDTQYRYLSFNRKHKETMQAIWGKEIAVGMSMLDVIGDHPDREKAKQGFDRALSGESFGLEEAYGDELLSRQYWQNYWSPIRAETGGVVGLTCFVMNVTERKQAEEALRESGEKLRNLYDYSPVGIALTDMEGRYIEFNEAFRAICGYPHEELMALDYWTLTPREYKAQEMAQMDSLEKTGRYGPYVKEYVRKDGSRVPIQLNGALIIGKDMKPYIWSIVEDITERKKTEAVLKERFERIVELNDYLEENARTLEEQTVELEASQEQLKEALEFTEGIINAIPDILFEVDRDGRYHNIWTHNTELLAAQRSRLLGNTIDQVLPPDAAEISMAAIREAEEQGLSLGKIICLDLSQGERWFELSVSRKPGGNLTDPRFVVMSRDVTERHAMEIAREAALAEAQRLVQMRSAFMAQMSHELRTPLNGILGYAQNLLQGDGLGEKQTTGLNIIRHSGEHLLSLINGLLDHAAIEAGKFELVPDDFELEPFLGGIIGIIRVRAEQKNLAFTCEAAGDLPAVVRGDAQRLRQVLINLLANAVKFTDSGAVTLRVSYPVPSRIRFEVQDSGVGIAADQLEHIFLPFEQAGEIQRRAGGSGLGLAISRTLVRLMGGDIRVESRTGAGSTFSFEIEIGSVRSDRGGLDAVALSMRAETRVEQAISMLPAPPRQELDTLHTLALRGSMRDVTRHADRLAEADARYQPFAAQLRRLAQSFQTKALLGLIEQYRDREQEE